MKFSKRAVVPTAGLRKQIDHAPFLGGRVPIRGGDTLRQADMRAVPDVRQDASHHVPRSIKPSTMNSVRQQTGHLGKAMELVPGTTEKSPSQMLDEASQERRWSRTRPAANTP